MQQKCAVCGQPFEAKRVNARFCGATCRKRASRGVDVSGDAPVAIKVAPNADLLAAVTEELTAAGKVDTRIGQQALLLTRQLCGQYHTMAGMSTLSKELDRIMGEALRTSTVIADPLDELRAKRDAKRAG